MKLFKHKNDGIRIIVRLSDILLQLILKEKQHIDFASETYTRKKRIVKCARAN